MEDDMACSKLKKVNSVVCNDDQPQSLDEPEKLDAPNWHTEDWQVCSKLCGNEGMYIVYPHTRLTRYTHAHTHIHTRTYSHT